MSEGAIQEHPGVLQTRAAEFAPARAHDRGLFLIALFKLGKSLFFFCVGIGIMKVLHKDLGDVAMRLASGFHFDVEGKLVAFLMAKIDLIDTHHLKEFSIFTFAYSALALTEGVGLWMEKVWAEFLTLGLTISFLPWEIYEIVRHADGMRITILLVNLAVLGYLLLILRDKRKVKP